MRVAPRVLHIEEAFAAGATRLVDDDHRLLHQAVLGDDALDGARHDVGAAARPGGDDEFDWPGRLPGRGRRHRRNGGPQGGERAERRRVHVLCHWRFLSAYCKNPSPGLAPACWTNNFLSCRKSCFQPHYTGVLHTASSISQTTYLPDEHEVLSLTAGPSAAPSEGATTWSFCRGRCSPAPRFRSRRPPPRRRR